MKKKFLKSTIFTSITIFLISCGSTNIAQPPENTEETVSQTHENITDTPSDEINKASLNSEEKQVISEEESQVKNAEDFEINENSPETTKEQSSKTESQNQEENKIPEEKNDIIIEENTQNNEEFGISTEPEVIIENESFDFQETSSDSEMNGLDFVSISPSPARAILVGYYQVTYNDNNSFNNYENKTKFENENQTEIGEKSNNEEEFKIEEKVSEEDSNFKKAIENAPTTDEREKISEYRIFDEPEVVVHDLPEEIEEVKEEDYIIQADINATGQENNDIVLQIEDDEKKSNNEIPENLSENTQNFALSEEIPNLSEKSEDSKNEEISEIEDKTIEPSRSVVLKLNQYLDITYPGSGWTYIGERDKKDNKESLFNYFGRKINSKDTTFSLRAKKAGIAILHFYKNDALTGQYIDDYLAVTVQGQRSVGRVKAPSYANFVPSQPQRRLERENVTEKSNLSENLVSEYNSSQNAQEIQAQGQSQNQKEFAEISELTKIQDSQQAKSSSQNSSQLSTIENDIKTVIQTTDEATKNSDSREVELIAQKQDEKIQVYNYTPISSESVQAESEEAQNETQIPESENKQTKTIDESLLEKAKKDFSEKNYADALKEAQEYYNNAETRLDEALFLLGQISESDSPIKNIQFATDSYDMLMRQFPQSEYWRQAKQRSTYLKRFYIDIR